MVKAVSRIGTSVSRLVMEYSRRLSPQASKSRLSVDALRWFSLRSHDRLRLPVLRAGRNDGMTRCGKRDLDDAPLGPGDGDKLSLLLESMGLGLQLDNCSCLEDVGGGRDGVACLGGSDSCNLELE